MITAPGGTTFKIISAGQVILKLKTFIETHSESDILLEDKLQQQ
jgi:hypothetical protein